MYYLLFSFFSLLFRLGINPENQTLGNTIKDHFADKKTDAQGHPVQRSRAGVLTLRFCLFVLFLFVFVFVSLPHLLSLRAKNFGTLDVSTPLTWKVHKISRVNRTGLSSVFY